MNQRDLIRMAVITILVGANMALSEMAAGSHYLDVIETLKLGSAIVLWSSLYITIAAAACNRPLIKTIPTMSVSNIWAFVYGLGFVFFTTVYCATSVNTITTTNFLWGLCAIGSDDIAVRRGRPLVRSILLALCLVLTLASTFLSTLSDADTHEATRCMIQGLWSCLAGGLFLPVISPFVYTVVRSQRHYSPETVIELIQFAMPFAAILSIIVLVALHYETTPGGARTQFLEYAHNYSLLQESSISTARQALKRLQQIEHSSYLIPLVPLTALPTAFFAVQTILLYSTVDFIVPTALALSIRVAIHNPYSGIASFAIATAVATVAVRAYVCYADTGDDAGRLFTSEEEETGDPQGQTPDEESGRALLLAKPQQA